MKTKLLALLLTLAMLTPVLAACGNTVPDETESDTQSTTAQQESESTVETEPYVNLYADLGEADYNDRAFRMMFLNEEKSRFVFMEDYMGEPVDDAVFEANAKVMDLANIKMEAVYNASPMTVMSLDNRSGDISADLYLDPGCALPSLTGIMLNLRKLPHINWDAEWWPKNTLDAMTLGGTTLMACNYASYENAWTTCVVFANMDMIDKYGLEDPHKMMKENRWTLDEFISMTKDTYDDINGDGLMEQDVDIYGFANHTYFYCFFEGWNIEIFDKTEDDNSLYLNIGENIATLMEKLYGFFKEGTGVWHSSNHTPLMRSPEMFVKKNAIFVYYFVGLVEDLMGTDINYAILPFPKLDATVEEYYSGCMGSPFCASRAYPVKEYDMLGYILEAMAIAGYEYIYPAYVETALKYRYSPTEDDSKVIDMIFKNRRYGFSWMYNNNLFPRMMEELFADGVNSFKYASYIASNTRRNEVWLDRLEDKFIDLGDN